jgi:hypothetical protein
MKEQTTGTHTRLTSRAHRALLLTLLALAAATTLLLIPSELRAQDVPRQRDIRGYVPPDQLVSFRPETPFSQFVDFLNPIFERVNGNSVIDPESRQMPIGLSISGMQYFDAFELVLNFNQLTYRETDRFFIVEEIPPEAPTTVQQPGGQLAQVEAIPATLDTREIQISAVLFSINKTKARDLGTDWNVFFGGETQSGQGGQGGQIGPEGEIQQQGTIPRFFVRTDDVADAVDNYLLMPDQFEVSTLTRLFRFLETEGAGETNPSVIVQDGQQGRIQVGTDFPFVTRDFSGNTLTQFVSTGIIIEVTPTVITEALIDTVGAPTVDFIHLNVRVENSNGQISAAGPIVDRSAANTQVLLLDGEQTVIGGLYTTDETRSRRGIPFLKDLPGWFLGIRYLVSVENKTKIQRELVILLRAKLIDPVRSRNGRPFDQNLLERWRRRVQEDVRNMSEKCDPQFSEECTATSSNE